MGQVAIAAVLAVGLGSLAESAQAATLSVNGLTLIAADSPFESFTGVVTPGSMDLSYGPTPVGNVSFTGAVGSTFTYDFNFTLVGQASALGFVYSVAPTSGIPGLSLSLWSGASVVPGNLAGPGLSVEYASIAPGAYTLQISGSAPSAGSVTFNGNFGVLPSAVPVPTAILLFGSGLLGLAGLGRVKRSKGSADGMSAAA